MPVLRRKRGRHDARRCIGKATTAVETTGERWNEAEVNRIAGKIALMSPEPNVAKAQAYFERALAIAGQQQAKSWKLRAAMSLAAPCATKEENSKHWPEQSDNRPMTAEQAATLKRLAEAGYALGDGLLAPKVGGRAVTSGASGRSPPGRDHPSPGNGFVMGRWYGRASRFH
jgi:hypothetical protein